MGILGNVNFDTAKLDSLLAFVQNSRFLHTPFFTPKEKNIIKSDHSSNKAHLLFKKIIEWQNGLTQQRTAPGSQKMLYHYKAYSAFVRSQSAVNKLKRKFNKLYLEGLTPAQLDNLVKERLKKIDEPVDDFSMKYMKFIHDHFGYNECALESFAEGYFGIKLLKVTKEPDELIQYLGFEQHESPHYLSIKALTDVLIKKPLSANTWGFPGQENTSFTVHSDEAEKASDRLLDQIRKKRKFKLNCIERRDPLFKISPMSHFKHWMAIAKLQDGELVANCGERNTCLFRNLVRERKYEYVAFCAIKGGDHRFVIVKYPNDPTEYVLDAWDGGKCYPASKLDEFLRDWTNGTDKKGRAITEKFDPDKQSIVALAYNLYPFESFKKVSKIKHPHLLQLLEKFHSISDQNEKMTKALEILSFIENKMPLYDYFDPALHDLYDQLMYLTKKERKKGLKCTDGVEILPINEALKNLDKPLIKKYLSEKKEMDSLTLLHALKASFLTKDMEYYTLVSAASPPNPTRFLMQIDPDPKEAVKKIYDKLFPSTT